jgi:hypothetical protein
MLPHRKCATKKESFRRGVEAFFGVSGPGWSQGPKRKRLKRLTDQASPAQSHGPATKSYFLLLVVFLVDFLVDFLAAFFAMALKPPFLENKFNVYKKSRQPFFVVLNSFFVFDEGWVVGGRL